MIRYDSYVWTVDGKAFSLLFLSGLWLGFWSHADSIFLSMIKSGRVRRRSLHFLRLLEALLMAMS